MVEIQFVSACNPYLLSIDFNATSLTALATQLKINPLYATLSGFKTGNTLGVGTFYDFINRLWDSNDNHLSLYAHPLKLAVMITQDSKRA